MGRKYVIELCEKPMKNENGNDIWRVKGFNTLVFDQNGLDKLEEYKEPEKETHKLKVGDVIDIGGMEAMVTYVARNGSLLYYIFDDGSCNKLFGIAEIAKLKVIRHEDSIDKFVNRRE